MRLHILGASGSGTTTLGAALAKSLGVPQFDVDDYYWLPTDPPFEEKRPVPERLSLLSADLERAARWVLSGSLVSWGTPLIPLFDCVVFRSLPSAIRIERLRTREIQRFGPAASDPTTSLGAKSKTFLEWAQLYEDPTFKGRSRVVHERWLSNLRCPVIRLEGDLAVDDQVARVVAATS